MFIAETIHVLRKTGQWIFMEFSELVGHDTNNI